LGFGVWVRGASGLGLAPPSLCQGGGPVRVWEGQQSGHPRLVRTMVAKLLDFPRLAMSDQEMSAIRRRIGRSATRVVLWLSLKSRTPHLQGREACTPFGLRTLGTVVPGALGGTAVGGGGGDDGGAALSHRADGPLRLHPRGGRRGGGQRTSHSRSHR